MPQCDCWAHRSLIPKRTRRRRPVVAVQIDDEGLAEVVAAAVLVQVADPGPIPDELPDEPRTEPDEDGS